MLTKTEIDQFAEEHGDGVVNGLWWIFHDGAAISPHEVREPPSDARELLLMKRLYWESKTSTLTQEFYRQKNILTASARGGVMPPTQAQINGLEALRDQATAAQQSLSEIDEALMSIDRQDLAAVTKVAKKRDRAKQKHRVAAQKAEQARVTGDTAEATRLEKLAAKLRDDCNETEREWRALKGTHAHAMRRYHEQQAQTECWEAARQIETIEL